jgi:hypothetical protein
LVLFPAPSVALEASPRGHGTADLGETTEDELDDQDDDGQEDEDERAGHTRRWVRYVMPVMVEVDCDTDEITNVVTLPGEVRLDRDDTMNLCIYSEKFRRRSLDGQVQAHACTSPSRSGSTRASWPAAR